MVTPRVLPLRPGGLAAFRAFLKSEYSEENIDFWISCEEYKEIKSPSKLSPKARKIYEEFISVQATKEVGLGAQKCGSQGRFLQVAVSGSAGHGVKGNEGAMDLPMILLTTPGRSVEKKPFYPDLAQFP